MSAQAITGARARRGAGNEPKRKRARDEVSQPSQSQTAKPPGSGRSLEAPIQASAGAHFNPMHPFKPATIEQAVRLQSGADLKRAIGRAMIDEDHDHTGGRFELAEADSMEAIAAEFMDVGTHVTGSVRPGNGGEVIVATREAMGSIPGVIDTVRENQNMLTASASRQRLELAGNALTLAVDAAESIKPKNSLEKMLAHQLATSHRLGMLLADQSSSLLERTKHGGLNPVMTIEAARLANTAARMMASFQEGLLALDRIRRGGRQTVKVIHQHVEVGSGGQAVVAGSLRGGGRKRGGRDRK